MPIDVPVSRHHNFRDAELMIRATRGGALTPGSGT
jgi:hypothetical protein